MSVTSTQLKYTNRPLVQAQIDASLARHKGLRVKIEEQPPAMRPRSAPMSPDQAASNLVLCGTIAVVYRAASYNIPVSIYIPIYFPNQHPLSRVVPTDSMSIHSGRYVNESGWVTHPMTTHWDVQISLMDYIAKLQEIFSLEPPVYAKKRTAATIGSNLRTSQATTIDNNPKVLSSSKNYSNGISHDSTMVKSGTVQIPIPPPNPHLVNHIQLNNQKMTQSLNDNVQLPLLPNTQALDPRLNHTFPQYNIPPQNSFQIPPQTSYPQPIPLNLTKQQYTQPHGRPLSQQSPSQNTPTFINKYNQPLQFSPQNNFQRPSISKDTARHSLIKQELFQKISALQNPLVDSIQSSIQQLLTQNKYLNQRETQVLDIIRLLTSEIDNHHSNLAIVNAKNELLTEMLNELDTTEELSLSSLTSDSQSSKYAQCVSELRAIEDTLEALANSLDESKIDLTAFLKAIRTLGRESFRKRLLLEKMNTCDD